MDQWAPNGHTTCYYLLLPTTTCYYLLLPTATYYYLFILIARNDQSSYQDWSMSVHNGNLSNPIRIRSDSEPVTRWWFLGNQSAILLSHFLSLWFTTPLVLLPEGHLAHLELSYHVLIGCRQLQKFYRVAYWCQIHIWFTVTLYDVYVW